MATRPFLMQTHVPFLGGFLTLHGLREVNKVRGLSKGTFHIVLWKCYLLLCSTYLVSIFIDGQTLSSSAVLYAQCLRGICFLVEVEKTNGNPYCISVCATRNTAKVDNSYCNTIANIDLVTCNLQFPPLPARISVCLFLSNESCANHKPLSRNKDSSFLKLLMLSLRKIKSCSYIHIWHTFLHNLKDWWGSRANFKPHLHTLLAFFHLLFKVLLKDNYALD